MLYSPTELDKAATFAKTLRQSGCDADVAAAAAIAMAQGHSAQSHPAVAAAYEQIAQG